MSIRIKYKTACDCGESMTSTELDTTQQQGQEVLIDLDWLGDIILTCEGCGDKAFLPAVSDYIADVEA
jgi:hypothetical protein